MVCVVDHVLYIKVRLTLQLSGLKQDKKLTGSWPGRLVVCVFSSRSLDARLIVSGTLWPMELKDKGLPAFFSQLNLNLPFSYYLSLIIYYTILLLFIVLSYLFHSTDYICKIN